MLNAFTAGLLLITISELGDKTFFISVILSTRYPRRPVFLGAVSALIAMTVISVMLGSAIAFLPKRYVDYAEIIMFIVFGIKLIIDAWKMPAHHEREIIQEAEAEIATKAITLEKNHSPWNIFAESFLLTFIAEWGDRTQIATITLAASNNALGVTLGAITGHTICALIAVMGGKMIAGKISEKTITFIGGILFLIFAAVAVVEMVSG
ncbi:MAG: hypothetical protein N5P05_003892 [Chroococcopsis gigantea SAG 12.99]|jgi:putative Ca2+/H+ antiporter (TMEM165/GDT1 family)|nr:TMEM165/GDT1 family protein [Chlorogloea purpurea SAG 13.99]MDV3002286.1 hypothetical protein [Chroococcopsis gigantea SAG 12.99]